MVSLTRARFIPTAICAVLLASCQASPKSAPIILDGEEAQQAFQQWAADLDYELEFPVQLQVDYDFGMNMKIEGSAEPMFMNMNLNLDLLSDSPTTIRSWGSMAADMKFEGEQIDFVFDFELCYGDDGLRFLLEDHDFFLEKAGLDIPGAYHLSRDRLDILVGLYSELLRQASSFYGPEVLEIWSQIQGVGELMHPLSFSRFMSSADMMEVVSWHQEGGKITLVAGLGEEFLGSVLMAPAGGVEMPFDMSFMEDMAIEIVLDEDSGAMLDYNFKMDFPIEIPVKQVPSGLMHMDMSLGMRFQSVPISKDAPLVTLPAASEVLVLDTYFDQFLPAIEMALDMQKQQIRQMMGEQESTEDFSF